MSLLIEDIEYVMSKDKKSFRIIFHVNCENFHKIAIEGTEHALYEDTAERRVIQYLSESKANKLV